jgi:hypothetical protein
MSSTAIVESSKRETLSGAPGQSVTVDAVSRGGKGVLIEVYQSPGVIGIPVKGDQVIYEGFGEQRIATALQDYKFSLTVNPGDSVVYSRDSSGTVKSYTHYKNDGTILHKNDNGSYEFKSNGDHVFNNDNGSYEFKSNGNHVFNDGSTSAVKFDELKSGFDKLKADYNSHYHTAPLGPTGAPTVSSGALIDSAEVPEVKF